MGGQISVVIVLADAPPDFDHGVGCLGELLRDSQRQFGHRPQGLEPSELVKRVVVYVPVKQLASRRYSSEKQRTDTAFAGVEADIGRAVVARRVCR